MTHLPQIAALGDTHMLIAKSERDGRTFTSVTPLDLEGRKKELARIISSGVQAEQIRSWSRIRSLAAEQCALYKEKSSLSCDPDLVTKIVCANLKHAGKRYGIQYYE